MNYKAWQVVRLCEHLARVGDDLGSAMLKDAELLSADEVKELNDCRSRLYGISMRVGDTLKLN